ncbi:MAG: lipid carrier protein, partial [Magnetospirillum sp.]|nr:lipid carrier protein [Magnetospirillum sp.]
TRQLVVEWDSEVVGALSKAVDGAGIDLIEELAQALGPFGSLFRRLAGGALDLAAVLRRDVETLRQALIAPALKDADAQSARIAELEAEVKALRKAGRRGAPA